MTSNDSRRPLASRRISVSCPAKTPQGLARSARDSHGQVAPQVRWALGQAAWSLYIRRKTEPMAQWAKQIADRRGAQVAIMALARKLAHVLYALWKHEASYDPTRAARLVAA